MTRKKPKPTPSRAARKPFLLACPYGHQWRAAERPTTPFVTCARCDEDEPGEWALDLISVGEVDAKAARRKQRAA